MALLYFFTFIVVSAFNMGTAWSIALAIAVISGFAIIDVILDNYLKDKRRRGGEPGEI